MSKTIPCPHCGKPIPANLPKILDKTPRTCQVCGKEFIASKSAKYCSNACTQRAKYARKKAAQAKKED